MSLSSFETLKTPKQAFVDILTAKAFFEILVCLNIKRSGELKVNVIGGKYI